MMSKKYHFPPGHDLAATIQHIDQVLRDAGFTTVCDTQEDWCVIHAKRDAHSWTHFYHGLTSVARAPRTWLRISGPEETIIASLLQKAAP